MEKPAILATTPHRPQPRLPRYRRFDPASVGTPLQGVCWSHVRGSGCEAAWDLIFARARVAGSPLWGGVSGSCRFSALPRRSKPVASPVTGRGARTRAGVRPPSIGASVEARKTFLPTDTDADHS